jgi:HPt (histidine-containing phosphotransfer) domain-containing protein
LALFGIHVHALKSASANIGADELSKLAYDLEIAAQNEDMEYIKANCGHFLEVMDKLLININEALSSHSNVTGGKDDFDTANFMHELKILKQAHDDMDGDVINSTITSLLNYRCEDSVKADIRNISSHLLMVEYDEATVLIDKLLERDTLSVVS